MTLEYLEVMEGTMQEEFDKQHNNVNHPAHYNTDNPVINVVCPFCKAIFRVTIECIDVIRNMPSWKGNAIKYLWRAGLKKEASMSDIEKEIEDLHKAAWYINDRIKYLESKNNTKENEG